MTVTTVYPDSTEGYIVSANDATWAVPRDATTGSSVFNSNNYVLNSARFSSSLYSVYQGMSKYSVSSITGVVSSVVWNTYINFLSGIDTYGSKAVAIDWGTTLEVADLVSRSELTAATLLASTSYPSSNNIWKQWTSEAGMNSYIQNATTAYFLTCSDRQYSNVAPVGDVYWAYASNRTTDDSYLTVTWAPPEVTGTATANLTSTRTASGTVTHPGTATASLGVTAAASGTVTHFGASTLTGELTASATGVVTRFGTAEVTASLTAGATGIRETFGTAEATSSISAEGVGSREISGTSSFSASLTSTANGMRTVVGNASFVSTESMSADGTVTRSGTASLAGSLQASAVGLRTVYGTATFTASFTASAGTRTPMYVFTYTTSVAVGGTTHTTTIGDTTQGVSMGDNTDSAASSMIREAS